MNYNQRGGAAARLGQVTIIPASAFRTRASSVPSRPGGGQALYYASQPAHRRNAEGISSEDVPINAAYYLPTSGLYRPPSSNVYRQRRYYRANTVPLILPPAFSRDVRHSNLPRSKHKTSRKFTDQPRHNNLPPHFGRYVGHLGLTRTVRGAPSSREIYFGKRKTRRVSPYSIPSRSYPHIYRPPSRNLRQPLPFYMAPHLRARETPSYVSYPPSSVQRYPYYYPVTRVSVYHRNQKPSIWTYKLAWRIFLKFAQLLCGLATIGLVVSPVRGSSVHDWFASVKADGQLAVIAFAASCSIVTAIFFCSIKLSTTSQGWRNGDGLFNAFASLLYLIAIILEIWYSVCYPPIGKNYPQTCYRNEWGAAAAFAFFAFAFHLIDFILALRSGIDLL